MATTDLKDRAVLCGVAGMHEVTNDWDNVLGLQSLEKLWWHDRSSHSASSDGCNDVRDDVVLCALLGESFREANLGELRGRVIGLAEAAKETSCGCSVDDSAVLLLSEVGPCSTGTLILLATSLVYVLVQSSSYLVGALDVDCGDQVPVGVLHVLEADVAENTGIVDQDIDAAEGVNGSLDDLVTKLDAVVVCNGLASSLLDLVDDDISSLLNRVSI